MTVHLPQHSHALETFRRADVPVVLVEAPPESRRRMAVQWARAMWADAVGVVALAHGRPVVRNGRYRHDGFTPEWFAWPDEADQWARRCIALAALGLDVWTSPMLRSDRRRVKANGAGGRWAWADVDGPMTPERAAVLELLGDDVRVVASGTGHHVYVRLDGWHQPEVVEEANMALRDALDADAKWSNESLLRPPGTFNQKPKVRQGEAPALVQVLR